MPKCNICDDDGLHCNFCNKSEPEKTYTQAELDERIKEAIEAYEINLIGELGDMLTILGKDINNFDSDAGQTECINKIIRRVPEILKEACEKQKEICWDKSEDAIIGHEWGYGGDCAIGNAVEQAILSAPLAGEENERMV